ncbi:MAG: MmgE/PrpD family protein [Peptococcaceae bacterium]|jgi:2-methylcitrate dehydratase PrpD|nr:MmgE/PrpD family protein [Peptococcaceae bacterium]
MDAAYLFAKNFKTIQFTDLPKDLVEATKKQILDFFGVAFGGATKPGGKELRELSLEWGGAKQSRVMSWGDWLPAPNAAQINASMGHSLDYDDVHEAAVMHPGVVTIPTVLALADLLGGISGKEFITAVALGGDFICRLGLATRPGENIHLFGWHFTTLNGYKTSAAVAGRLLGLTEEQIVDAIGIAYHQCSGNGQPVKDGALTKRLGPGFSVRGGIQAALLAQKGVTGAKNSLEGLAGYYQVYHMGHYSQEILTKDIGKHFESINISIKPYPCCRGVHPFIDAALNLVHQHAIQADDVASIHIWCGIGTHGLLGIPLEVKAKPRNQVDSQFSLAWGVATAIVKRRAGLDDFTEEAIHNQTILAMAAKVSLDHDPELDRADDIEPARVEIKTKSGQTYTEFVEHATGTPEKPLSYEDCEKKFRDILSTAERQVPEAHAAKVIDLVKNLDQVADMKELIDVLSWH